MQFNEKTSTLPWVINAFGASEEKKYHMLGDTLGEIAC